MPNVKFILSDGTEHVIEAEEGESLMHVARDNEHLGIEGMCGGFCNCATCHIYVDDAWASVVPEISEQEDEMLEGTFEDRQPNSRLGCQIELTSALDGLVIRVPRRQS